MVVLLYCSFSVPFTIAFVAAPGDGLTPLDYLDIAIDAVFAVDILLNFLTSRVGPQGNMATSAREIAGLYLRSWFIPDIASTVPFDLIVTVYAGQGTVNLGAMRLIRMVRLIRALKFLSSLNKLKDREGFESFGAAIGIATATFLLFFTAHLLGCFFALLALYEQDYNWMIHYNADVVTSSSEIQYGICPPPMLNPLSRRSYALR